MFVMDSQTIVKPLSSMSNARETPLHYISSTQNISTFKDASLSSSLKPKPQENGTGFTSDDTEISIFDAHEYFSESNDSKDTKADHDPRMSSVDGYCRNFWTKSFRSTPNPSSVISCNSQTGLLPNPKHLPLDCISKRWHSAKKWLSRRKRCCCHGEKSVQVKDSTSNSEHKRPVVLMNTTSVCQEREESSPDNIDVSRQQRITASGRSFIDGAVGFTFPIPTNLSKPVIQDSVFHEGPFPREDDMASDASSDLFEIDSLSVRTTSYPMYRRRNSVDHDHGEVGVDVNDVAAEVDIGDRAALKCVAEGPPMLPLHLGGRPPLLSFGSSQSAGRLSPACEFGVSQLKPVGGEETLLEFVAY